MILNNLIFINLQLSTDIMVDIILLLFSFSHCLLDCFFITTCFLMFVKSRLKLNNENVIIIQIYYTSNNISQKYIKNN